MGHIGIIFTRFNFKPRLDEWLDQKVSRLTHLVKFNKNVWNWSFFFIIINSTSIFFHFISFLFHFFLNSILKKISYNHLRPSRLDHIELILIQFNFKSNFNKEQGLKGFFFLSISSFSSQFHPQIFFLLVSHITFRLTKLIGSW